MRWVLIQTALLVSACDRPECSVEFEAIPHETCRQLFSIYATTECSEPAPLELNVNGLRVNTGLLPPGRTRVSRLHQINEAREWRVTGVFDGRGFARLLKVEDRRWRRQVLTKPRVDIFVSRTASVPAETVTANWAEFVRFGLSDGYWISPAGSPTTVSSGEPEFASRLQQVLTEMRPSAYPFDVAVLERDRSMLRPAATMAQIVYVSESDLGPNDEWVMLARNAFHLLVSRSDCSKPMPPHFARLYNVADSCRERGFESALWELVPVDHFSQLDLFVEGADESSISVTIDGVPYPHWSISQTRSGRWLSLGGWLRNGPSALMEIRSANVCTDSERDAD